MPQFPTTCWSLIHRASTESSTGSRESLGQLLLRYRQPMLVHLRFKGQSEQAAEDLVQDFMVELLDKNLLSIADANKGKFRTLLLTALDRFAISRYRYESAAKRSPDELSSLDAREGDDTASPEADPGAVFERAWALDVLAETLAAMQAECERSGQLDRWAVFDARILGPLLEDQTPIDYDQLAKDLGLANEKAAMNQLVTAKRQFARTLREQVRVYVTRANDDRPGIGDSSLFDEDNMAKSATRQLVEHTVQQAIEREIAELQTVLANCRTDAAIPRPSGGGDEIDDPRKSGFWRRLTQHQGAAGQSLESMYAWGNDLAENDLDACFQELLDADVRHILGDGYGTSGAVREFLDQAEPLLPILEHLKEWASVQRLSQSGSITGKLASAVYFLVIAIAAVRLGESMTGLEDRSLLAGLQWVCKQPWVGEDYHAVANQAINSMAA